jgi:hypothetical protein
LKKNLQKILPSILLLILIAILAYFGRINKLGFYSDDWYLLYGGVNFGAKRFFDIFSVDRPFRGWLQFILFSLFNTQILYYYLLAVGVRLAGALGLFWLLSLIWKDKIVPITSAAVLFLVYPGFLEQPNAMDYMAHQIALTAMIFSIAFSIKYFTNNIYKKLFYFLIATAFALICYSLMEYFLGMEGYRFLFIAFYLWDQKNDKLFKKLLRILFAVLPFIVAPIIFAYWRLFIFSSTRVTTSAELILSNFTESILLSIVNFLKRFLVDIGETVLGAYIMPISQLVLKLGGKEFIFAIFFGLAAAAGHLLFIWFKRSPTSSTGADPQSDKKTLILTLLALLGAVICLVPVNLAERDVSYLFFNRFALPSALGVTIFIVGMISMIPKRKIQISILSLFVFVSVFTQFANNVKYSDEWLQSQKFWQSFIWRVPNLENGTTLVGLRPSPIYEGYYIWSPANLIYRPTNSKKITISAEVLNRDIVKNIQLKLPYEKDLRSLEIEHNYAKTLVFSQPTEKSCLRLIDNQQIELSIYDDEVIELAAPYSSINMILADSAVNYDAFSDLFRTDTSADTWCFYYEQAALARQFGDWDKIIELIDTTESKGLSPYDSIEWMPFIQAFAYTGNMDRAELLIDEMIHTDYYKAEACEIFKSKPISENANINTGNQLLEKAFCAVD